MLTGVAARLSSLREERPSAGTKYRLMGMVADITEVTEMLSKEVLERVKQEAVLDVDMDVDFDVMAEEVSSEEATIPFQSCWIWTARTRRHLRSIWVWAKSNPSPSGLPTT